MIAISLCMCASVQAYDLLYKDTLDTSSKNTLSFTLAYKTGGGMDEYGLSNNFDYFFDSRLISLSAGLMLSRDDMQITTSAVAWPLYFLHSRIGAGLIAHGEWYRDISIRGDILPGIYWQCKPCSWFSLNANVHKLYMFRHVFAMGSAYPLIKNSTMAAEATFLFYLPFNTDVFLGISTYERYRYMIFGATSFYLGCAYHFDKNISFVAEAIAHYIDFFTLSGNFEDAEFSLTARVQF